MAGVMIPLKVLKSQSLFSLLYMIDHDLCEHARAKNCPFVGALFITPITSESLGVGPRIYKRHLKFDSACAAAVPGAVVACCHLRFGFGIAGFTGRRCCCWSAPFARDKNPRLPWSVLKQFVDYGVQPSNAGNTTFENFLFRAFGTGDCPDVFYLLSNHSNCQGRYCPVLTQVLDPRWRW